MLAFPTCVYDNWAYDVSLKPHSFITITTWVSFSHNPTLLYLWKPGCDSFTNQAMMNMESWCDSVIN